MKKNSNNIKIEREINELFSLTLELYDLIEVKEYSFNDVLKRRHDLYKLGIDILEKELNIQEQWYKTFSICLSYCYHKDRSLNDILTFSKYTNVRRNYDWIIYIKTSDNTVKNEEGILLEDKEIFFNLCLLLCDNITAPSNILHLLQLGYDYFNLDLSNLLKDKIIENKIEKINKSIIYLL